MRKLIALGIAMLLLVTPAFAAVGVKVDGVNVGTATDFNFTGAVATNDGSTWTFPFILAGASNGGSISMTTTDTTVSTSYALVKKEIGVQVGLAGTLANGEPGQILTVLITLRAGSGTYVLSPTTTLGFTSLTFDAAGEYATLLYIDDTSGWVIVATNATITQP